MLDDLFAISYCGLESTQMQEFLNIKTGSKKLQYSIEKTFKMHVGKSRDIYWCKYGFIDSWKDDPLQLKSVKVKETTRTKYLGEIISSDGKNTENISARKNRGFGTVRDITKMLDTMCLGP